jgi:hypothetical protein
MEPDHLRDDLRAEVVLILLETEEKKLIEIHESSPNGLKFYTVRIIMNLIQSKTSLFYKKFRQHYIAIDIQQDYSGNNYVSEIKKVTRALDKMSIDLQLTQDEDHEEREAREDMEDKAMSEIDNLYWYNGEMVKLYLKYGNYRAIEENTRIPYTSAYKTIQKSLTEIKQKVLG